MAIGILMGLQGCPEKDAFDDLANAVHETGVGLGALAGALIDLVSSADASSPYHAEAVHMWGHLIIERAASARPS